MKGWYGNSQRHSLASKGISTKNLHNPINKEPWRESNIIEFIDEVPIDWLWQFREYDRGQEPDNPYALFPNDDEETVRQWVSAIVKEERKTIKNLKKDIMENGLKSPLLLLVGMSDGKVSLGEGNHRIKALKELGYKKVPVTVVRYKNVGNGIIYDMPAVTNTHYFPGNAKPTNVFPDLDGYKVHPGLGERDWIDKKVMRHELERAKI